MLLVPVCSTHLSCVSWHLCSSESNKSWTSGVAFCKKYSKYWVWFFFLIFFKQPWSACEWKPNQKSFSVSQMILVFASPKTTVLELKWILWMRIAVVGRPQFEYFYYFSSHSAKLHLKQNTLRFQHKNTVQCLRVIWVPQSCWYQAWETCCAAFPSFCLSPLVS